MTSRSIFAGPVHWAGLAALAFALGVSYWPAFVRLTEYWAANDMYSYGYLVPIISGYLIWLRRERLRVLPVEPDFRWGTLVLASGVVMLIVGRVSTTNVLEWLSFPVVVLGVCLLVLGSNITRAIAFPLLYLLAMIPFWDVLTSRLHAPFQLYSAIMGVGLLQLFDLPVVREGFLIHLPNITLEVAEVCSGVNQLVAIMCIGIPITHMNVKAWPRRIFIVFMAAVIALLSNGARVALISLYAFYGMTGPDGDVHGPYSVLRTMAISAVGFVALFWLIARFADRGAPVADAGDSSGGHHFRRLSLPALVTASVLLGTPAALAHFRNIVDVPPAAQLAGFPISIAGWSFRGPASMAPAAAAVGFDHSVARTYGASDGTELEFLVGYFERQRQGRELAGFELGRLLSADGERFNRSVGNGVVTDFFTTVGDQRYYVTYWYTLNGRIGVSNYEAKWWMTWDSLVRRRSNGGVTIVRTRVPPGASLEESRAKVGDFVEGLMSIFKQYVP